MSAWDADTEKSAPEELIHGDKIRINKKKQVNNKIG